MVLVVGQAPAAAVPEAERLAAAVPEAGRLAAAVMVAQMETEVRSSPEAAEAAGHPRLTCSRSSYSK